MGNCLKPQRAATWADGDEWEEAAEVCSSKAAAAAVEEKRVEVKIRVTRRQLQEVLEKGVRRQGQAAAGGGGAGGADGFRQGVLPAGDEAALEARPVQHTGGRRRGVVMADEFCASLDQSFLSG
ncbi:unnamed protein product [Miscanthus lutarioriparius]|uniref:Uncharacterized protein n=1 Tax=Miscanthus lutarioriparius TaxID=422564 RepID=A0A811SKN5_9POAL|nr:unnamed protein product [Miscanthus lutarioriparius]